MSAELKPSAVAPENSLWMAVICVGLATFAVVTTEMLPVGLLTTMAESLNTSNGKAGMAISLPALLAALFAPFVVIASGGTDRRIILRWLLLLLVIANIASALAPGIISLLAARILVGFCMGGIWAIAGGLSSRLVTAQSIGLATAIVFGGVAAASVVGVPLGAFIGDYAGWRWAFGGMALFSVLVLTLHWIFIPALPVTHSVSFRQFVQLLQNPRVRAGLVLTLLLVAGHFMAFTFVRPLLLDMALFEVKWIGILLLVYGITGVVGNFLTGIVTTRRAALTLLAISLGLMFTPLLFLSIGHYHTGSGAALILWGLAYGGVSVGLMSWMMEAAPRAIEIATSLYVGVFNIGIAGGSWFGGQIVDRFGLVPNLWVTAAILTAAALLSLYLSLHERKNTPVTLKL
ncbi:MFS transporter [Pantoea coffeiphila]|uniref:MFS transporter n=1 Tax=Pantoea coffeiphila TaxID=1465635 RepID=A0A2S9IES6_9GAMM|nr:MFS transporter [Pantoea coffeiphila]PRD16286.1 MFS transporter [Pantoea coffeiphila]